MAEVQTSIQDIDANGKAAKVVTFVGQLDETNVELEAKKVILAASSEGGKATLVAFEETPPPGTRIK